MGISLEERVSGSKPIYPEGCRRLEKERLLRNPTPWPAVIWDRLSA